MSELESLDPHTNPCQFKRCCKSCMMVDMDNRPSLCLQLECNDYKPCKKCGMNRELDARGLCLARCSKVKSEETLIRNAAGEAELIRDPMPTNFRLQTVGIPNEVSSGNFEDPGPRPVPGSTNVKIGITLPGTPPEYFTPVEAESYRKQWDSYSGFYRDPTAYAVVHNVIIMEIELNFINAWIGMNRANPQVATKDMEDRHYRLIQSLEKLRNQLPKKDAEELSDDEKSLGMIYERYCKEKNLRSVAGISRILTQDAVALAPLLDFKMDPTELFKTMGYRVVDIEEAMKKFHTSKDIPNNVEAMAEFLGFFLKEEYAITETIVPMSALEDFETTEEKEDA